MENHPAATETLSLEDLIVEQNKWAMGFLKQQEETHNVKILFAVETGSRGYGTDMNDSDFDIKGFFISPQAAYMSVMGAPKAIRFYHQPIVIAGKEYELDLELLDFKSFLKKKVQGNKLDHANFWFFSTKVYINSFPKEIFTEITANLKLPIEKFYAVVKGFMVAFQKAAKAKKKTLAKDMLNSIVISLQFLHTAAFREFPAYNFKEECELFKSKIKETHMSEWESKVEQAIQLAHHFLDLKRTHRHYELETVDTDLLSYLEAVTALNPIASDVKIQELLGKQEISKERAEEIFKILLPLSLK